MKKSSCIRHLQIAILLFLAVSSVAFASENLTAHFIDVGQGDSILLQFDGKNVLIDGGIQEMGPRVETYLRNHGVSSLDLLVATHPHEDYIGDYIGSAEGHEYPDLQVGDEVNPRPFFIFS